MHRAFAALRAQSHEHKDGWGVAHFDGTQPPQVAVGVDPAYVSTRFLELGAVQSRSLLAHIRLASVGAVCPTNSHPFVAEGWAFSHNGTIHHFAERRAAFEALLPEGRRSAIRGQTDSERCFQLFLHHLKGSSLSDVARALTQVMRAVAAIFDAGEAKQSATNFLVSNGTVMAASRKGRTLFTAEANGARMIASEPLWHDHEWTAVPEDHVVGVGPSAGFERFDCKQFV
jgi:predicted glutamine amidotransferase